LVVDDEPANRLVVRETLASAGWDVIEAVDGDDAIGKAVSAQPALIIMDIQMAGLDGFNATRTIRSSERPLSSVPILAYSVLELSDEDLHHYGFDGRIPKPFEPNELIAIVGSWQLENEMEGAARLGSVFDAAKIQGLVARFRDQLVAAIDAMDAGTIRDDAHRIAGVAGTLGFAAVSRSWLLLAGGDDAVRQEARIDARKAIAAIDRNGSPPSVVRL
jgi:CheY-like chemotaxis protein